MFLETKRLILRKFREEDFPDFAAWRADEDINRLMGNSLDVRGTFDWLKDHEPRGYVLVSRETGRVIGDLTVCGVQEELANREPLAGKRGAGLSFSISQAYRRRGLMFEALEAVLRQLFAAEGFDYVQCGHFPENTASAALQKKLGFTYLTTLRFQAGDTEIVSVENVLWQHSFPKNIQKGTDLMMSRPAICVSTDSVLREGAVIRAITCPKSYPEAVAAAGGLPLLCGEVCAQEMAEHCDALLLSGGSDLSPSYYGEEILNDSVKVNPDRDEYEMELAKAFLARKKPILAICRGFQIVNVSLGGDLYQDLVEQKNLVHFDPNLRHPVKAEEGSVLAGLYGTDFCVNSTHHQAVRKLGAGLRATAWSPEGIIEAYEHENGLIWGTQFHPERLTGRYWDDRTPDMNAYFSAFIRLVKGREAP